MVAAGVFSVICLISACHRQMDKNSTALHCEHNGAAVYNVPACHFSILR